MRAALLALALAACSSPPPTTRLLVVVDSDYAPGTELQRVRIETFSSPSATMPREIADRAVAEIATEDAVTIPFSFAVAPGPESAREIALSITGTIVEAPGTITRRVRTSFVAGQLAIVRVHLSRACAAMTCDAPTTCERGACVAERIEPTPAPGLVPGSELDAAVVSADAGPPPPDAPPPDGGPGDLDCTASAMRPELVIGSSDFDVAFDGARYAMASTTETGLRFQTATLDVHVAAGTDIQRPDLEPHPGGWVASYASTAGTVAAAVFIDSGGGGAPSPVYDVDAPYTAIAADAVHTVMAFSMGDVAYGSHDSGRMMWSPAQRLETSVVMGGPAIARFDDHFVIAWGGTDAHVHLRELLGGATLVPLLTTYAERVGPIVHVRVAVGPGDLAVATVDEVASRPVSFVRFTIGEPTPAHGVVLISPVAGASVIGAAPIALNADGTAGILIRTDSGPGWELWLAEVGTNGVVALAKLREAPSSTSASRQWIWATETGWAIAWDEGATLYTENLTCFGTSD